MYTLNKDWLYNAYYNLLLSLYIAYIYIYICSNNLLYSLIVISHLCSLTLNCIREKSILILFAIHILLPIYAFYLSFILTYIYCRRHT